MRYCIKNKVTNQYVNSRTIPIRYQIGIFQRKLTMVKKTISSFFDETPFYFSDLDQLNNGVNFNVASIVRCYGYRINKTFDLFLEDCVILDEEGNELDIFANISCGRFRGIVNY